MADISVIKLPSGTSYNIKDAQARADIETIESAISGGMHYIGVTTTALTDGASTNPITIGGQSVTAKSGDIAIYGSLEFIFSDTDSKWHEFGSTGSLKALAFKDSASGNYTPNGSISTPAITITPSTSSVRTLASTGELPECTLPKFTATVASETLTLGWSAGSFDAGELPEMGAAVDVLTGVSASASQPKFTGTAVTVTVS